MTRYVTARLLCSCSHGLTAHDIETKRRACSVTPCDCGSYVQAQVEWTDRTVTVEQYCTCGEFDCEACIENADHVSPDGA